MLVPDVVEVPVLLINLLIENTLTEDFCTVILIAGKDGEVFGIVQRGLGVHERPENGRQEELDRVRRGRVFNPEDDPHRVNDVRDRFFVPRRPAV